MKVLHVVENFGAAGLENVVRNLVLNHNMEEPPQVCVLNELGCNGELLRSKGFKVWSLDWKKQAKSSFRLVRELRKIIKQEGIDTIHAHNFSPFYFCSFAALCTFKTLFVTFHGFINWRRPYTQVYAILSLFARKIVVVSDAMLEHYRPLLGGEKKLETVYNGIDLERFTSANAVSLRTELGIDESDFVLGSIGRISPVKNYPAQIRLVAALKDKIPNLKLVLVTSPSPDSSNLENELRILSDELGVADRVVFAGFRSDVENVLHSIDIFLMTSFSEGTSMAILEAFAAGVPVVASDVGGNVSLIEHDKNGFLFDLNDLNQLKKHILALWADGKKLESMSQQARESSAKFSIRGMISSYESLYAVNRALSSPDG